MRKNILTVLVCVFTCPYLFSQIGISRQRELQRKQDSLKAIVSNLNGIAKVDALNKIVDIYQYLDDDNQMQVDSATPYAVQSTIEAKKIGYRRGLGYSYLKQAYCEYLKALIYKDKNKIPDPNHLESLDQMTKQAMLIGEELNDEIMIASSYLSLGRIEKLKGKIEGTLDFYKKAIASIEKNSSSNQKYDYKEMWFPASDNGRSVRHHLVDARLAGAAPEMLPRSSWTHDHGGRAFILRTARTAPSCHIGPAYPACSAPSAPCRTGSAPGAASRPAARWCSPPSPAPVRLLLAGQGCLL